MSLTWPFVSHSVNLHCQSLFHTLYTRFAYILLPINIYVLSLPCHTPPPPKQKIFLFFLLQIFDSINMIAVSSDEKDFSHGRMQYIFIARFMLPNS